MCGRFSQIASRQTYARLLGAHFSGEQPPLFNAAPSMSLAVCRLGSSAERKLISMRWGLIPHWWRREKLPTHTINARAETVAEKPMFRDAFRYRHCLVPADGFYEWQARPGGKQPYYIRRADGEPMMLAGLWEAWRGPEGRVESFTIIVTRANDRIRPIHDRMPVIVEREDWDRWLHPSPSDGTLLEPSAAKLEIHPVSRAVNNPRNNDPSLIEPVEAG